MANQLIQGILEGVKNDVQKLTTYETDKLGIKLILNNSVIEETCKDTGEKLITIPNYKGLLAAAALTRIKIALRLDGSEIKFIRKAMNKRAKQLAIMMEVKVETVSRWENDKQLIGPSNEKLLRLLAYYDLVDIAPAIDVNSDEIINMRIRSVRATEERVVLRFELVLLKKQSDNEVYEEYKEAA